jgi:hypothetical protein
MNHDHIIPALRRIVLLAVISVSSLSGLQCSIATAAEDSREFVAIGSVVGQFTFTDARYLPRTLSDF